MSHDAETIDFLARAIYAWDGGNWGRITDGFRQIKRRHAAELAIALGDRLRPAPRVIETIEELDALPEGAVIRSRYGVVAQKTEDAWEFPNEVGRSLGEIIDLPATVLWAPGKESTDA